MKKLFGRKPSHESNVASSAGGSRPGQGGHGAGGTMALAGDDEEDGFDVPPPRTRGESTESGSSEQRKKRFSWLRRGGQRKPSHGRPPAQDLLGDLDDQSAYLIDTLVMNGLLAPDRAHPRRRDGNAPNGQLLSKKRREHKVYLEGPLEKQGNFFKTWHSRHFTLTAHALSYYESQKKYAMRVPALGVLAFRNMYHEGGAVVNEVSPALARRMNIRGKPFLFCVSCVGRTYFFSAPSEEERDQWTRKINSVFERYLRKKKQASANARRVKSRRAEDRMRVFDDCRNEDDLDEAYSELVAKLMGERTQRRVLLAWRCYVKYKRLHGDPEADAPQPLRATRSSVLRPTSSRIFKVPEF